MRSNWLRAPQDLNACDWVPSFTIGSTGSRPSTHGTRAASLSDRALSSWQALKKQPRHDAQGEFKQVLKLLVVLDSCEAAAVWLKWHAAGACGLASHPGASASHPGANTAHRSASIHRRRATVEPQHIAALRCRAHEECVWALGEAAAKLLACACGGVWPCGRVASPFLANTAVRSILL